MRAVLNDTNSKRQQIWNSLKSKKYRDAFTSSHLATNIASQIFALREKFGWTQRDLARETGMAQARISLIENVTYDSFTVATLKRIASAFDVMLVVRFVPYSEGVDWIAGANSSRLAPASYTEDSLSPESQPRSLIEQFLSKGSGTQGDSEPKLFEAKYLNPKGQTDSSVAIDWFAQVPKTGFAVPEQRYQQ
jgi:transcriptional regulator with XRE-family HTH domain